MTDYERMILAELLRRQRLSAADVKSQLFDKQINVLNDEDDFIACLCTRRAGKSYGVGGILLNAGMEYPNALVPYIGLTRRAAKNIMWPILRELCEKLAIDATFKDGDLTVVLPNKTEIFLVGADLKNFIERLRGAKYPVAVIDEAQAYRTHIEELVDDVLTPAVADYKGKIIMTGTPGPSCSGFFYEATQPDSGWSVHRWSVFDNPHMPHARQMVDKLIARKKWTKDNPTLLREWYGQWVEDPDALVYKFSKSRNVYENLPNKKEWDCVLGVDYGFNDQCAFSIVKYHPNSPELFIDYAYGESGMIPSTIAEHIKMLVMKYKPIHIVADTGGLGKTITEEMIRRYSIPMQPAEKTDKFTWIALLNGDFVDGNAKVKSTQTDLIHQYLTLTKDDKGKEDPLLPNDLCDATLYAYRKAKAYAWTEEKKKPVTKEEIWKVQEEKIWESELQALRELEEAEEWGSV